MTPGRHLQRSHFDSFWAYSFEGSFWPFTRIYFDSCKGRLKRLFEESRNKSTLQKSCFDPYFGSFVLLFWVISTLIMGNFYSYFGSFLPWLGIISTHILVILWSLVRVKLPSTWFMNMHTQESMEVLVNNLLSIYICYDNR